MRETSWWCPRARAGRAGGCATTTTPCHVAPRHGMGGRSCSERSGRPASACANSRRRSSTSCSRPGVTANARAWSRSAGGRGSSAGKAMPARASPAAWRTRYGECPGVVEISRPAGIFSGKGDAGKGGPGSVAHSIRRMPGRGRDQPAGRSIRRERRCRQGRGWQRDALDRLGDRPEIVSGRVGSEMSEIAGTRVSFASVRAWARCAFTRSTRSIST